MTAVLIVQAITLVFVLFNYIAARAANVRSRLSGQPALPSVFQVRELVGSGALSRDDAGLLLAAQGFGPELVVSLLKAWSESPTPAGSVDV